MRVMYSPLFPLWHLTPSTLDNRHSGRMLGMPGQCHQPFSGKVSN